MGDEYDLVVSAPGYAPKAVRVVEVPALFAPPSCCLRCGVGERHARPALAGLSLSTIARDGDAPSARVNARCGRARAATHAVITSSGGAFLHL